MTAVHDGRALDQKPETAPGDAAGLALHDITDVGGALGWGCTQVLPAEPSVAATAAAAAAAVVEPCVVLDSDSEDAPKKAQPAGEVNAVTSSITETAGIVAVAAHLEDGRAADADASDMPQVIQQSLCCPC